MKSALIEPLEARYAPAAILSISAPAPAAEGGAGNDHLVTFTISLDATTATDVVVDCVPVDGTATNGSDYDFTAKSVTIAAGTQSTDVSVTIHGDDSFENDENFSLK